jgi:CHAT domain-containing protein/tetratricopeptide (TPR) repeat protein
MPIWKTLKRKLTWPLLRKPNPDLDLVSTFIDADIDEAQRLVEQHPELLDGRFDRILSMCRRRQDEQSDKDWIEDKRLLLFHARIIGIPKPAIKIREELDRNDSLFDDLTVADVVNGLFYGDWDAKYRPVLEAYPILLRKHVDDVLREVAMSEDDAGERLRLGACRARLALCRMGLVNEAFVEEWQPVTPGFIPAFEDSSDLYLRAISLTKENVLVNFIAQNPKLLARIEAFRSQTGWMDIPSDCPTPQGFEAEHAAIDILETSPDLDAKAALIRLCETVLERLAEQNAPHFRAYLQYVKGESLARFGLAGIVKAGRCYLEASEFYNKGKPLDFAAISTRFARTITQLKVEERTDILELAIEQLEEALPLCSPEKSAFSYAQACLALGDAYCKKTPRLKPADFEKAVQHYQEAIRVFKPGEFDPVLGVWWTDYIEALKRLEGCYFTQRLWESALEIAEVAISVGEEMYENDAIDDRKEKHTSATAVVYQHAAYALGRLGRIEEALLYLERGRTRVLGRALDLRVTRPAHVPNDTWETFEKAAWAKRSFNLSMSRNRGSNSAIRDFLQGLENMNKDLGNVEAVLTEATKQVQKFVPHFLKEVDGKDIKAALLDEHTVLVTFCITEQGSLAFIIDKENPSQIVNLPDFHVNALSRLMLETNKLGKPVGGWLINYLAARKSGNEKDAHVWHATLKSALETLAHVLLAPVVSKLPQQGRHIIFMPPGALALFPLHAAPLPSMDGELLCDRYQVSYIPSIKLLVNCQNKSSRRATESVYAVINPQEDPQLTFTYLEGAALASVFAESKIYEGPEGTKDALIDGIGSHSYLHFSCHGEYNEFEPGKSGLVLADDDVLTVDELLKGKIDLSGLRMVTLSACETGMIDIFKGNAEEHVGLPSGFMLAGVPCIVSSLWTVPDISSAILMEQFYYNHLKNGMTLVEALGEAQKYVRHMRIEEVIDYISRFYSSCEEEKKVELFQYKQYYQSLLSQFPEQQPFAHPYYWAAFVVNGM